MVQQTAECRLSNLNESCYSLSSLFLTPIQEHGVDVGCAATVNCHVEMRKKIVHFIPVSNVEGGIRDNESIMCQIMRGEGGFNNDKGAQAPILDAFTTGPESLLREWWGGYIDSFGAGLNTW